jgi:ornithine cyclodeaminase/alanine dehydrogenase-like protein (mu-crystallin family)
VRSSSDLVRLASGPYGPTHTYIRYGNLPGNKGYSDLIFLYNIYDAQFEAIIQSAALQGMRVAATSALGSDLLCRSDVSKMGLFGSGWQASANLRALCHVRPTIKQVFVFSPNEEHRSRFASRMAKELNRDVQPVSSPEQAVIGMDLICEASSARSPVFDGTLLQPGQHVVSVGGGDEHFQRRPIDPKAVGKCSFVAAHSLEVRYGLEEIEDCIAEGGLTCGEVVDLPDLVTGRVKWKPADRDITFFKNNIGLGSQFAAVGGLVLQKAKNAGLGFAVPQEKVSQVMTR